MNKIDELSVGLGNYPVVVFEGIVHLITEKKMPEPDDLKKMLSLLYQKYDAEAVFVDEDKNVYVTSGLMDKFELMKDGYTVNEA